MGVDVGLCVCCLEVVGVSWFKFSRFLMGLEIGEGRQCLWVLGY